MSQMSQTNSQPLPPQLDRAWRRACYDLEILRRRSEALACLEPEDQAEELNLVIQAAEQLFHQLRALDMTLAWEAETIKKHAEKALRTQVAMLRRRAFRLVPRSLFRF